VCTVADPARHLLAGWGNTAPSAARVLPAATGDDVTGALAATFPTATGSAGRGVIARGLGRSYGDAAQNAGGAVVDLTAGVRRPVHLDAVTGLVTAWAGVSLDEVMRTIVPRGFFVPVTPGTRHVTLGGAVAADIHGKNHHADGTFGRHVTSVQLRLASGDTVVVGPDRDPELYWATTGGLGLTGIIEQVTFRALPIETSRMLVETSRAADLDAVMASMAEHDEWVRYSVAWIDVLARGRSLGRSVLTVGDHAPRGALGPGTGDPFAFDPRPLAMAPPVVPNGLLNRFTIKAFNELWFRKAPVHRVDELQSIGAFFHPLDGVVSWNRLYGPRGFVQYQCVVPFGAERSLRRIVERLSATGTASFLAVLKRFGSAAPGPLSFPTEGWTLTLDIPAGLGGLASLLDELDRHVLDSGGRLYLAKDGRMNPAHLAPMYPRLAEWQAVQRRADPLGRMQSDLARRLSLCLPPEGTS
jgi:decaprenylphospho-beta-D-ribofuranose 2-oxidase